MVKEQLLQTLMKRLLKPGGREEPMTSFLFFVSTKK